MAGREKFVSRKKKIGQSTCSGKTKIVVVNGYHICLGHHPNHRLTFHYFQNLPWELLEMQTLKLHPRPSEPEPAGQQGDSHVHRCLATAGKHGATAVQRSPKGSLRSFSMTRTGSQPARLTPQQQQARAQCGWTQVSASLRKRTLFPLLVFSDGRVLSCNKYLGS